MQSAWEVYDKWHLSMKYIIIEWQRSYLDFLKNSTSYSDRLSQAFSKIDHKIGVS